MGILLRPQEFIRELVDTKLPAGFSVCELGDQYLTKPERRLAADWYRELGCGRYEAIDGNGLGTLTHDLNLPIPFDRCPGWLEEFHLVTDFGTGEHIFNQAQVWRTLHDMCRPAGYIVFDRPISGYPAHGYWLADKSLFPEVAAANEYEVLQLETGETARGWLIRGVFKKTWGAFRYPQQGRYRKKLKI